MLSQADLTMKVLYISDRQDGGILRHVKCLRECLPPEVETYEIGHGGDEEFAGSSGHDIREFWQIRRVVGEFKPDIVHFHIPNLLMALYVGRFTSMPCVCSWHTLIQRPRIGERLFFALLGRGAYYLPVSSVTWHGLKQWLPHARGEVFFNSIDLKAYMGVSAFKGIKGAHPVVGMVGRNAHVKDWPSFHEVERLVKAQIPSVEFVNGGEERPCDGREEIQRMDVFVMTSRHEELPTTLLECFALKTAICGFLPVGGTTDVLAFSTGAVRSAFIEERSCARLALIVIELLRNDKERMDIIEDGWHIVNNHFNARRQAVHLLRIYKDLSRRCCNVKE